MTVPDTAQDFRVGGLTLKPGDEIPEEFVHLAPAEWASPAEAPTTQAPEAPAPKEKK